MIVVGIGNRWRRDDAAGLEAARRLRRAAPPGITVREEAGEPASLLEAWAGVDEALVVDAVRSGSPAGTLHRCEANNGPLPVEFFRGSTHALGVADAIELARELDRLPKQLVVYGIEGEDFEPGEGLTPAVEAAVARLVSELVAELGGAEMNELRRRA